MLDRAAGSFGLGALFTVDPVTGSRAVLSDFGNKKQGATPNRKGNLYGPLDVAVTPAGSILVTHPGGGADGCVGPDGPDHCGALYVVDPATGSRTQLSDFGNPAQGPIAGLGPGEIGVATFVASAADGSIFCTTHRQGGFLAQPEVHLIKVNPVTGQRSLIAGPFLSFDPFELNNIAVEAAGTILMRIHWEPSEGLFRIDPATGAFDSVGGDWGIGSDNGGLTLVRGSATLADGTVLFPAFTGTFGGYAIVAGDPVTFAKSIISDLTNVAQGPTGGLPVGVAFVPGTPPPPPPPASGTIIATDPLARTVVAVDPATGNRSVISDFADSGKGPTGSPLAVTVSAAGGLFVTDSDHLLFTVTSNTGDRAILSDFSNPAQGAIGYKPWGIIRDTDGNLLVSDRGPVGTPGAAVWRVRSSDGFRTLLSDFSFPPKYQNGPQGVALSTGGEVYVVDPGQGTDCRGFGACGALFHVDRVTGAKTLVSDFGNPAQGPLGDSPIDVALDTTDGTFVVADTDAGSCGGCGAIFRVDPSTGTRTLLSDEGNAAQGITGGRATGVAITAEGTILEAGCIGPSNGGAICTIDRTTGARTAVTDFNNASQGPLGVNPLRITVYP